MAAKDATVASLPTLLGSRRGGANGTRPIPASKPGDDADVGKGDGDCVVSDRQPATDKTKASEETPIVRRKPSIRVRNTFIEGELSRSSSLEDFYQERDVHTCPSSHAGRLKDVFKEYEVTSPVQSRPASPQRLTVSVASTESRDAAPPESDGRTSCSSRDVGSNATSQKQEVATPQQTASENAAQRQSVFETASYMQCIPELCVVGGTPQWVQIPHTAPASAVHVDSSSFVSTFAAPAQPLQVSAPHFTPLVQHPAPGLCSAPFFAPAACAQRTVLRLDDAIDAGLAAQQGLVAHVFQTGPTGAPSSSTADDRLFYPPGVLLRENASQTAAVIMQSASVDQSGVPAIPVYSPIVVSAPSLDFTVAAPATMPAAGTVVPVAQPIAQPLATVASTDEHFVVLQESGRVFSVVALPGQPVARPEGIAAAPVSTIYTGAAASPPTVARAPPPLAASAASGSARSSNGAIGVPRPTAIGTTASRHSVADRPRMPLRSGAASASGGRPSRIGGGRSGRYHFNIGGPGGLVPGSPELPSIGSAGHNSGRCKPCAFMHNKGCENGVVCAFCHLCEPGEKKRRHKEKLANRRKLKQALLVSTTAEAIINGSGV